VLTDALPVALRLIAGLDASLVEIVTLSLAVSLSAVLIATVVGLPLGACPGRGR
jgi:tungstate transport system permease protein